MRLPNFQKVSHPAVILALGLLIAQIIATIQVYLSNFNLYHTLLLINSYGYLAIPNGRAMSGLQDFAPAFLGGLFFSFTIGAGITLGSMAASWLWVRVFLRKRPAFHIFQLFWLGLLVLVNSRGFSLMSTLYFLLIPPVVFTLTAKGEANLDIQSDLKRILVHLIPLPLLALLWFTQLDNDMFLDLRDNLLLSNLFGRKFTNFYYTYTLYPAEAFKALDQKIIKTSGFKEINNRAIKLKLGRKLIDNDYLPLNDTAAADMVVYQRDGRIELEADGRRILQTSINHFLFDTGSILKKFSEKVDRHAVFRQLTFISILIGFPVLIYTFLHAAFYYPGYFIMGRKAASLTASIICLLLGIIVLVYFQSNRSSSIRIENVAEALRSDRWQIRVAALKMIQNKKMDIADYAGYQHLINSSIPQERYWLAKTLAYTRQPGTFEELLKLLHDKNLNVRTMALYSLGLRKDPRAIRPILNKIRDSEDWYCQMYAYRALRSIGWKQTKSP
jgi:hypothetical protein